MEALLATLPAAGGGAVAAAAAAVGVAAITSVRMDSKKRPNAPPEIPGLPLIGNLLQLKGTKPHKTFAKWSETYGPIYTTMLGVAPTLVLNSTELVREAMVDKYSSISTRKLTKAFEVISRDKMMVSMSDYGDFHKMVKRFAMAGFLGPAAQRQFRDTRMQMMDNMVNTFRTSAIEEPNATQDFRKVFRAELFRLNMLQSFGEDVSSIYVEELGREVSATELCDIMVVDTLLSLAEVDWRDFFPFLSWVPNKGFEEKVIPSEARRSAVTRALINLRRKRLESGEANVCYLDTLLAENTLTEEELIMMSWEVILGGTDTTLMTTEWAMFELAKNPEIQDRLYQEIKEVCGDETLTEDHLPRLPYLKAVFYETLRRHSPGPILPPRFIHEDTTLGGYQVAGGTDVILNIYGCNHDPNEWEKPEQWRPERFLDASRFDDNYKPIAFGAGKRICGGMAQATTIASTSIGRFVQEFTWRLKKGDEDNEETAHFVGARLHPLEVHVSPRGGR
uniref:Uncharacterized protein n=1 Tax=Avena sativa TaxID=4498 RepID=A0ACD5V4Q9_AVESA